MKKLIIIPAYNEQESMKKNSRRYYGKGTAL